MRSSTLAQSAARRAVALGLSVITAAAIIPATAFAQDNTPATRPAEGGGGQMGNRLERLRGILADLHLTDTQQAAADAAMKDAGDQIRKLPADNLAPQERQEQARQIFSDLRYKITDSLSPEQRKTFEQKIDELRANAPGNRPTSRPTQLAAATTAPAPAAAGAGHGQGPLPRIAQALEQLGLSDDQKTQIKQIYEDVRTKGESIRQIEPGPDRRQKLEEMFRDLQTQLRGILTDEQQQKFRQLIQQNGGLGEGRRRGPGANNADPRPNAAPDTAQPAASQPAASAIPALAPGSAAPEFKIGRLDGPTAQLSSFAGHVAVIVFGSYTSPTFREHVPQLETLKRDYGTRATFLVVYTKEAHPAGGWEVDRNRDAHISLAQPQTESARRDNARKVRTDLKITVPIAIDSMDDATATAYGGFPNGAVVINRDGTIAARQKWFDAYGLRRAIDEAIAAKSTTQPAPDAQAVNTDPLQ